jgi:hypothetical protein
MHDLINAVKAFIEVTSFEVVTVVLFYGFKISLKELLEEDAQWLKLRK